MGRNLRKDIVNAIQDQLVTLRIAGAGDVPILKSWDGTEVQRGLCVVDETERFGRGTNASEDVGYQVLVVFVRGLGGSTADLEWADWRRKVREKFHNKKLTGVTEVYVCKVSYAEVYLARQLKKNCEASAITIRAWAEETRP